MRFWKIAKQKIREKREEYQSSQISGFKKLIDSFKSDIMLYQKKFPMLTDSKDLKVFLQAFLQLIFA